MGPLTRMLRSGVVIVLALMLTGATVAPRQAEDLSAKRLIYYGWSSPDTQYVRENWREIEGLPFDGIAIVIALNRQAWSQGNRGTPNQLGWNTMGRRKFGIEEFDAAIDDLRAPKWRHLTDNFLPVILSSSDAARGLNWFDDRRWETISSNFEVMAAIAATTGVKGLLLDPEGYHYFLFSYEAQRRQADRSFGDYAQKARERGRQVMRAIATRLSRPVLLSLFGYTLPLSELDKGRNLNRAVYGLLPAFYDGLLDAMPQGGELVDGYEFAYGFKKRDAFLDGYERIRERAVALSGAAVYQQHVRAGFGLMLDHRDDVTFFTPDELRGSLLEALRVSDKYVWLYSQGPGFFPIKGVPQAHLDALKAVQQTRREGQ